MADSYHLTVTTKSGETNNVLMIRSQYEMINGFIGVAHKDGAWVYLAPEDVKKMRYVKISDQSKWSHHLMLTELVPQKMLCQFYRR